jgi:hypothetical protein
MIKKGGEQNNNNKEIQPFHAKYAITSMLVSKDS